MACRCKSNDDEFLVKIEIIIKEKNQILNFVF